MASRPVKHICSLSVKASSDKLVLQLGRVSTRIWCMASSLCNTVSGSIYRCSSGLCPATIVFPINCLPVGLRRWRWHNTLSCTEMLWFCALRCLQTAWIFSWSTVYVSVFYIQLIIWLNHNSLTDFKTSCILCINKVINKFETNIIFCIHL